MKSIFNSGLRRAREFGQQVAARMARPYSQLHLVADGANWVLREEMLSVQAVARSLGVDARLSEGLYSVTRQATFHSDQFAIKTHRRLDRGRVGAAYFHGMPGTGEPAFDELFEALRKRHHEIDRLQVSHKQMQEVILSSGIDPAKVFLIPIGINTDLFQLQSADRRRAVRQQYDLPDSAVVIGSFQKDGVGWGEGLEPKPIKGPDVFLKTIELLKDRVKELHVLLSGPARGYVIKGLKELGVPCRHTYLERYDQIPDLYQAIDAYIVSSRQEGGPKAVLESMAAGVRVISTRVGQATDLVEHGVNGWLADVEDAEGLAHWTEQALDADRDAVVAAGRRTAEANSYVAQTPLWRALMDGFVETRSGA